MKKTLIAALMFSGSAYAMPEYDIDASCADASAVAVKQGLSSAEAVAFIPMCTSMVSMSRDVASRLWDDATEQTRAECAEVAETKAEEIGVRHGWYPALLECLSGEPSGKGDRLVQ